VEEEEEEEEEEFTSWLGCRHFSTYAYLQKEFAI